MKKLRTTAALAAVLSLGLGVAPAHAADNDKAAKAGTKSLAAVLAADGTKLDHNWRDFDIVEKAVLTVLEARPDSPVGVLTQGSKRVTAFIPTDAAFRRLVTDLTGKTPKTEKATFAAVASVADVDLLETILLYHVVPGATITSDQAVKADGVKLRTAEGGVIRVNVRKHDIRLNDRDFDDRNPRLITAALDINRGNRQIAHGIHKVLRPSNL
ncbi:hypothetical protein GCM10009844_28960 [Nocardioides koreensis]|uniref:FAS1 domain-containing protein n=1 Tax=Nocardioides koreensis TaxID=433651 RepID=A0ABP5LLG0_9ACTN